MTLTTHIKFILAALLCLVAELGYGQTYDNKSSLYKTDSIVQASANKSAIQLVNDANTLAVTNPVLSMKLASEALNKSIFNSDKTAQYQSYNTLGTLYFNIGNYSRAAEYFKLASDGFAAITDDKSKAYADKYLAASNANKEDIKAVANAKNRKSKIDKKSNSTYSSNESYWVDRANSPSTNTAEKIDIFNELGNVYLENKDTVKALKYLQKAGNFTLQADDITLKQSAEDIGNSYTGNQNYKANIAFQNDVLTEGLKRGSSQIVSQAAYNIGATWTAASKPDNAIPFLQQSIQMAEKTGDVNQRQKATKELAKAYENSGQYEKALQVIKKYVNTLDSVKNLNQRSAVENIALNEEFLKQEKRIQSLIASQKIKEADIKRQRTLLWSLIGALSLFSGLIYALFRNIKQKQKANRVIKLQSLRTQMNPHFIFNSLNSVNNFISKNDERSANKFLSDFSKLMRTVLKNSDQDFVSLETEIQTLRIYLDLEHFRFGEKFDFTLEVDEDIDTSQVEIPPMLIQPYIENAIWHGLRYKEEKGLLKLHFFKENDKLFCTIEDNGIGRIKSAALKTNNQKNYQSTGIKNTTERIDLLNKIYGTHLGISITDINNANQSGTLVRISLPHILQTEMA